MKGKRLTATVLTILLIFTMLPTYVLAEEDIPAEFISDVSDISDEIQLPDAPGEPMPVGAGTYEEPDPAYSDQLGNDDPIIEEDKLNADMFDGIMPEEVALTTDSDAGGHVLQLDDNYDGGSKITVNNCRYYTLPSYSARVNNIHKGWSNLPAESPGETEVFYNPGETIHITDDTLLYARWMSKKEQYQVTYDPNGGTGDAHTVTVNASGEHEILGLLACGFTRENHTFVGWSYTDTGSVDFLPGDQLMINRPLKLYAVWKETDRYSPFEGVLPVNGGCVYMAGKIWRVIGKGDNKWLLICDEIPGGTMNWESAKAYCSDENDLFSKGFSQPEKNAVSSTTKTDKAYGIYGQADLSGEHLFLLSASEAETYFSGNEDRKPGCWWLRSPHYNNDYNAGVVYDDGSLNIDYVNYDNYYGVRPAFVLNLSSVLFTSAAEGGKSSATAGGGQFVPSNDGTTGKCEKKLTILDSSRSGFAANVGGSDSAAVVSGGTVAINYSGAGTGTGEYVSAMLCDSDGDIIGYASVAADSDGADTWSLTLPSGLTEGATYTLKVFSEQQNGDFKTDFASPMIPITLTVGDAQPTKEATPNAAFAANGADSGTLSDVTAGMKYSIDGGSSWTSITGTSETISSGVTTANGIKVYQPGNGTTTSDSDVQTVAVTKASKPIGLSKTDCTTEANNDGTISGITASMEYKKSGASAWTAGTGNVISALTSGTYYIRTKASGTILASDDLELTIAAYTAPGQVATPTFSPAGGTYSSSQSVTISCSTSDAEIYYTTNGTVPTSGSSKYTGAITVASTTTIKVIAVKGGMTDSAVATATYTIENQIPTEYIVTVTGGTGSGSYAAGVSVTITANAPESGKQFKEWTGTDGLNFTAGSKTTATATFTMPAKAVSVTATYEDTSEPPVPHEHSYTSAVTTEPTCTTKGVRTFTCDCGDSYLEDIPAMGHNYGSGVITKEPTTTEEGVKTITCKRCGHSYTESVPKLNGDLLLYEKAGKSDELRFFRKMKVGGSFTLVPKFEDGRVLNKRVVWESSNPDVATVTQDGKVTARSGGQTTISVRSEEDPGLTAYCIVSVTDSVTAVTLNRTSYAFGTGESVTLNATVLPFTAMQELEWSKNNDNVSIAVSDDGMSVTVTAVKAGKAKITAKAKDGSGKKSECSITIGNPVPDFTIAGKGNKTSVQAGKTLNMTVNWGGKSTTPKNAGVTWTVKAPGGGDASSIAAISSKGELTGITAGKVIVTATSTANPAKSASAEITVTAPAASKGAKVTGISFTNTGTLTGNGLVTGKGFTVKTKLTLSGKGKAASGAVAWFSSDTSVATVSQKGVIKAVAPGTVTITAVTRDAEDISTVPSASVTFSVYAKVKSVKLDKTKLTLGTQEGTQYGLVSIASMVPDNARDMSIKWTAGNKNVRLAAVSAGADPSTGSFAEAGTGVTIKDGEVLAVMGVAPGTVKLTGITTDGTKKKVTCTVTIRGQVTGLKLKNVAAKKGLNDVTLADDASTPAIEYTGTMKVNSSMTLTPVIEINGVGNSKSTKMTYATYKKYTDVSVSYRSSDTSVAIVNKNGKISIRKGVAAGKTVTIYVASADGKQVAQILITVK